MNKSEKERKVSIKAIKAMNEIISGKALTRQKLARLVKIIDGEKNHA